MNSAFIIKDYALRNCTHHTWRFVDCITLAPGLPPRWHFIASKKIWRRILSLCFVYLRRLLDTWPPHSKYLHVTSRLLHKMQFPSEVTNANTTAESLSLSHLAPFSLAYFRSEISALTVVDVNRCPNMAEGWAGKTRCRSPGSFQARRKRLIEDEN